jgi:hypothetical protein
MLAASQAVLAPASVSASAGPLGGITLLPSLLRKNDLVPERANA